MDLVRRADGHRGGRTAGRTMKTLITIAALALTLCASPAGAATVGTSKVYPDVATAAKGAGRAYRFTAPTSGRVDRLSVFLDRTSTAGKGQLGLYTGAASGAHVPRPRCVVTRARGNAWNPCSFAPYRLRYRAQYWLAVLQPVRSTGRLQYRERKRHHGSWTSLHTQTRLQALPAVWSSGGTGHRNYLGSIFADRPVGRTGPTASPTPAPT